MESRRQIHITGIVQGVGFRPFIYNLAERFNLKGYCFNDSEGVTVDVVGDAVDEFIEVIKTSPPPLSRIDNLTTTTKSLPPVPFTGFEIKKSVAGGGKATFISPDVCVCHECLAELLDPADRRYLYPFINCTNCGPRYSIVRDIPYDRENTTMAPFTMCKECEEEYRDPGDRRFHAEPNGCERCGPGVWLVEGGGEGGADKGGDITRKGAFANLKNREAIERVQGLLKGGAIVAIRGLGGFHLACDATNAAAVERLRVRKRGSNKPFAIMCPDMNTVEELCRVSDEERGLLTGRVRPIVILEKRKGNAIPGAVSPNNKNLGVMLPYTPLHYVLFTSPGDTFTALVMTSGNLAEEPIVTSNEEALDRLGTIADHFLLHNRDIYMRVDDSIVRVREESEASVLRRARGFTPESIELAGIEANGAAGGAGEAGEVCEEVLACGAELKNTLCLTKGNEAVLSQHIGDMENQETLEFFTESLENLRNTYKVKPTAVAHDLHPDYLSTVFANEYASKNGIPADRLVPVQHHHAHVVSVMAEHALGGEVIGVAFDGMGYGPDGNIWGGEFMAAGRGGFTRAAHLLNVPMPGGDAAIKEPWRMALAYLFTAYGKDALMWEHPALIERLERAKVETVVAMIEKGINSPLTSSAGRLFDAVASLAGIRDEITFEGEAAIELEMRADGTVCEGYPFELIKGNPVVIDTIPVIKGVVEDVKRGVPVPEISSRFHRTVSEIIVIVSKDQREKSGLDRVVLSGGVFQNFLLLNSTVEALEDEGFGVWTNRRVPPNDGGISLGQAAVALERLKNLK